MTTDSVLRRVPKLEPAFGERVRPLARLPIRHSGRVAPAAARPETVAPAEPMRRFAVAVLRVALEVIDQRRPAHHLRNSVSPAVLASLRGMSARGSRCPAVLTRVHLRVLDARAAEVFGTYSRGARLFAVAARVTLTPDGGMQLTALAIPD